MSMLTGIAPALTKECMDIVEENEHILTVVLPASECNLKCSWCFIKGKGENNTTSPLSSKHYIDFIKAYHSKHRIGQIGIQGYEPLLDETLEYTFSILDLTAMLDIPVTLVTNGTNLQKHAAALAKYKNIHGLNISIDASQAEYHDRTRGVKGAFSMSITGIETVIQQHASLAKVLAVGSVVQPGLEHHLLGMPDLLADLGVRTWVVNPLINIGKKRFGKMLISSSFSAYLRKFQHAASNAGIDLVLDDELGHFKEAILPNNIKVRRLKYPEQVIRLSPTGELSKGLNIISQQSDDQWHVHQEGARAAVMRL